MAKKSKKDSLDIKPVEYHWSDDMGATGFVAQEVNDISLDTITIGNSSDYNITGAQGASTITFDTNSINWNTSYTIGSGLTHNGTDYGKTEIKLSNGKSIDLNELADLVDTLKERLLILTPNFEQMEKYPMLKQMYDEYKAMEKLLSGPDTDLGDM